MLRLIAGRLAGALFSIFGASIVSFAVLRIAPGDPTRLFLGDFASEEALTQLRQDLGLGDPIYVQYVDYMRDFLRGDWGFAYSVGQPVTTQLESRLPATIELGLYAFIFAFVGALVLALLATYRRRPLVDGSVRAVSFFGLGTPPFWFGLIALIVFSSRVNSERLPTPSHTSSCRR